MLNPGDVVGSYEVLRKLRVGGMATLYLARRSGAAGFARHLAVKVVNEHLVGDESFVRMFIDEAKLAARIHHPTVVHVEDFGEVAGTYFIAMEYVHGCSLGQLLGALQRAGRRMAPELAVHIALRVAEGLHAAHECTDGQGAPLNVVHRDVNPSNILLAYKGHVKLIDFGIAKSESRSLETTGGSLKGKFRYMSPEQACGAPLDRRSDVYSLGITLWESITGRRLFDGANDMQVLEAVRNPRVDPPSLYVPGLPDALEATIMAALAPDMRARMPTALAMRQRLAEAFPAAAILDASKVSDLLVTVMSDVIAQRRDELPDSVSGVADLRADADAADEALRTMTVSDIHVMDTAIGFAPEQLAPASSEEAPPPPAPIPSPEPPQALESPVTAGPSMESGASSFAEPPPVVPRSRTPLVVGGLAVLGVVGVIGIVWVFGGSDAAGTTSDAPEATSNSAPSAPTAPGDGTGPVTAVVVPDEDEDAGSGGSPDAGVRAVDSPVNVAVTRLLDAGPDRTRRPADRTAMTSDRRPGMRDRGERPPPTMMTGGAPTLVDDVF